MTAFNHKCPVCRRDFRIGGEISGWMIGEDKAELTITVKVAPPIYPSGSVLMCGEDCLNQYTEAKTMANEAYDAVMEPFA